MSVTAVGPAFSLDGPRPVAPEHSLLETEGVVKERDATTILNGVNVWGYPTGCSNLWEPCLGGTFRIKEDISEMPVPRFDSFVVYKPVTCSFGLRDMEEIARRSEATLEATLSAGIEKALAEGVTSSSNPFFGDGNVDDLTGGTAVSAGVALSLLEEAIGETCRRGMIHVTPATVSALQAFPIGDVTDTRLITANGTPVVSGMGYQDVDTTSLPSPGATEDYAFATGPVEVYLGPIVITDVRETLDRSDNTLTFRAERYVVALWDTALQAAALVDWSL
jgi:hypothetical protein